MMDQIDDDISMSTSEDEEDYSDEVLKIDEYRNNIKENMEDYDSHISLIKALRYSGDYDGTRAAREVMNIYFPLSPEMWIEWANDERENISDNTIVYNLLRKATDDYRSVDVWLELCQCALGYYEDKNQIIKIFEEAVSQVGTQFDKGSLIWQMWMIYERQVLMNGLDESSAKDQRDRVHKLYMRQLSVPLDGNDIIFAEFIEWNKEWNYPEDEIRSKLEQSNKIADTFRPFEHAILEADVDYASKKTDPQQVSKEECWLKYLDFAKEHMNKNDIVNLYERSLNDICLSQLLWSYYLSYLAKYFDTDSDRILSSAKRAIRNNKSSLDLRLSLVRNMERYSCSADEIRATFNSIFLAKFADLNPFLPLWQAYLDFERRQLDLDETRNLTIIRGLFERLQSFENYLDHDPTCMLIKYWAFIEARYGDGMDKARELWALVRKSLGNGSTALWLENLEFERRFGDFESCKRLMSNAVNSFTDYPEYLFERVLRWVAEEGTIDSLFLFKRRIETQQLKVNERRLKESELKKQERSEKKLKRKPEERKSVTEPAKRQKVAEKAVDENKKSTKQSIPVEKSEHIEICEERCVFVSNLSFKATETDLREMFTKCGSIEDIRIVRRLTGESKGYAYIQWLDKADIEEALKLEHAPLLDRPMYVNRSDKNKRHQFDYSVGETEKKKLFVKNLPKTVTKVALEEIFGKFGALKDVRLVTLKNGLPKGIAYVEYGDEGSASRALVATDGLVVGQNTIEVLMSRTPQRSAPGTDDGGSSDGPGSFIVPRAVTRAPTTQKRLIHKSSIVESQPSTGTVASAMMNNADFKKFLG